MCGEIRVNVRLNCMSKELTNDNVAAFEMKPVVSLLTIKLCLTFLHFGRSKMARVDVEIAVKVY